MTALFDEFILFSFLGWIWETVYCAVKSGHWDNRGFLFGPVCPIYGTGVLAARFIFALIPIPGAGSGMPVWMIFLICAAGSAVLEYGTSFVLEKRFHARWWDYSSLPLNINGRIALPITACFGLAGIVVVRYLLPAVMNTETSVPALVTDAAALFLMWVFGADFALTEASLHPLLERIESSQQMFDERAEKLVTSSATKEGREALFRELEGQVKSHLTEQASRLTRLQRYQLRNIKTFRQKPRKISYRIAIGERLKSVAEQIRVQKKDEKDCEL